MSSLPSLLWQQLSSSLGTHFFGSSSVQAPDHAWERLLHQCVYPTLTYIPPLLALYAVSVWLLQRYTDWKGLKLQKLAGQLSMYPAFFVLIWYSHATLLHDGYFWHLDQYRLRQETSTTECDIFANLYIACNIVQALGQIQTERAPLVYQLLGHHVLSILCYASGFYFDRFRWWTAFAGVCELTNVFLVPVFACKEYFAQWKVEVSLERVRVVVVVVVVVVRRQVPFGWRWLWWFFN